jgi:predicted small metal-binding protein
MPDVEYKLFCCRELVPTCGFQVQARNEEEIMEHAKVHAEREHGLKEMGEETEEKVKGAIKSVKTEVEEKV